MPAPQKDELIMCKYGKCFGGYTDFCDDCKKDIEVIELLEVIKK